MEIIFPDHASNSLSERRISKSLVVETILNPNKVIESRKSRKIAQKVIGLRVLNVIYKETPNTYIVVTAYYSKLEIR